MRRCKNKRALALAIALVLMVGTTGNVFAAEAISYEDGKSHEVDFSNYSVTQENDNHTGAAVYAGVSGTTINSKSGDVNISYTFNLCSSMDDGFAVSAGDGGTINLGDASTENLNVSAEATKLGNAYALYADKLSTIKAEGKNIKISAKTVSDNDVQAVGIYACNQGGQITVNGENLTINVSNASGTDSYGTAGIMTENNNDSSNHDYDEENAASVTVNAKNTDITVNASNGGGIAAYLGSTVTVNNNLTINALGGADAIQTRGRSTININQDGTGTVKLNGNVNFASGESGSWSDAYAGSRVNINLTNADSAFNGNTKVTGYTNPENNTPLKADLQGENGLDLTINLSNGANWTTTDKSFVNHLNMTEGATANFANEMTVVNEMNVESNSSVKAETLVAADNAVINVGNTASLTTDYLEVGSGAVANLQGTTVINRELKSMSDSTVDIANLKFAN